MMGIIEICFKPTEIKQFIIIIGPVLRRLTTVAAACQSSDIFCIHQGGMAQSVITVSQQFKICETPFNM